jgi:ankyrin repeat protein
VGDEALVRQLLDKGADPNIEDGYFGPPLQQASRNGHHDIVLLLLERGSDINLGYFCPGVSRKKGALVFASRYGYKKAVKLFLNPKYSLHPGTSICVNAIDLAIQGGHQHVVNMLMEASEIKEDLLIAKIGQWMLVSAVNSSQENIIRWLLENGVVSQ